MQERQWQILKDLYRPFRWVFVVLGCLMLVMEVARLLRSYWIAQMIKLIPSSIAPPEIDTIECCIMGVVIFELITWLVFDKVNNKFAEFKMPAHTWEIFNTWFLNLPGGQAASYNPAEIYTRIQKGKAALRGLRNLCLFTAFPHLARTISVQIAIFWINPYIGLLILTGVVLFVYVAVIQNLALKPRLEVFEKDAIKLGEKESEVIHRIKLFKHSAKETTIKEVLKREQESFNDRAEKLWGWYDPPASIRNGAFDGFLYIGLFAMVKMRYVGWITPEHVILYMLWAQSMFEILYAAGANWRMITVEWASLEQLLDLLSIAADMESLPEAPKLKVQGAIAFEDVSFAYPERKSALEKALVSDRGKSTQYALSGVSFAIKPGQTVAFVGHSGAGKTTIATALLTRFYDPDSGRILIDGVDLRDVDRTHYISQVSIVSQDIELLSDTVYNNILFSTSRAVKQDEFDKAVRDAGVDEFVVRFKDGYQTTLNNNGSDLSGGQRQRIAIARALLKKAPILILDEATSALDAQTEERIKQMLLEQKVTKLVVAHRLSTIYDADVIFVLEKGKIVDRGTHGELLNRCNTYQKLVKPQTATDPILVTTASV